jgi:hypothetical protein
VRSEELGVGKRSAEGSFYVTSKFKEIVLNFEPLYSVEVVRIEIG